MSAPQISLSPASSRQPAPRKATRDTNSAHPGRRCRRVWPIISAGRPRWVRAGFVITAFTGFGILLYGAFWLVLPSDERFHHEAPGLESATRTGKRPGRVRRLADAGPAIAIASVGFGAVLLAQPAVRAADPSGPSSWL